MLNDDEVDHLYGNGKELWLRIEEFSIAYHARYKAKASLSRNLSYATVAAGICTAASTTPGISQYDLTAFPAALTAITATVSQILSPGKVQRESWDIWKKIESLKSDLASRCRGFYLADSYADEQIMLLNYSKHLEKLLVSDVPVSESHRKVARSNFSTVDISPRRSATEPPGPGTEEIDADQQISGSEGVQAMTRRVVSQ